MDVTCDPVLDKSWPTWSSMNSRLRRSGTEDATGRRYLRSPQLQMDSGGADRAQDFAEMVHYQEVRLSWTFVEDGARDAFGLLLAVCERHVSIGIAMPN